MSERATSHPDELPASAWARERFGPLAPRLRLAIPRALNAAHLRAAAGQAAAKGKTSHIYGYIWQMQHEELVLELTKLGDEVRMIKPKGAQYELVVIGEQNVIIYPWRFADGWRTPLDGARMRLSNVRRNMLDLTQPPPNPQLSIDDALLTDEEIEAAARAAEESFREHVAAARVVLVPYMSNAKSGILGAYWGDAYLADGEGRLGWLNREALPVDGFSGGEDAASESSPRSPIRPVGDGDGVRRFDDGELEEPSLDVKPPDAGNHHPGGDTSHDG